MHWHAIMPILSLDWTLVPENCQLPPPPPPPLLPLPSSTAQPHLPFVQICLQSGDRTRQELELVSAMLTFCHEQKKIEGMHAHSCILELHFLASARNLNWSDPE